MYVRQGNDEHTIFLRLVYMQGNYDDLDVAKIKDMKSMTTTIWTMMQMIQKTKSMLIVKQTTLCLKNESLVDDLNFQLICSDNLLRIVFS